MITMIMMIMMMIPAHMIMGVRMVEEMSEEKTRKHTNKQQNTIKTTKKKLSFSKSITVVCLSFVHYHQNHPSFA